MITDQNKKPLVWEFNQDDGFYFSDGFYSGLFKVVPCTLVLEEGRVSTTFSIYRQVDDTEYFYDVGMCFSLANAKQVCELLENG